MSEKVILYDLASRLDACWNPNVWKSRLALNFKNVPYTTEWVEYPDLAPKLKAIGIPPNPDGPYKFTDYTAPTVRLADGTYVMDSLNIAEKLEATYPEPSLRLETGLHHQAAELVQELSYAALPEAMAILVKDILREPSASWFAEDRHRRFGITLDELAQQKGGEAGWPAVVEALNKLRTFLTANKKDEGPFVMGGTPSYADFYIVALFEGLERVKKALYAKIVGYDHAFSDLHAACRVWTKRDD